MTIHVLGKNGKLGTALLQAAISHSHKSFPSHTSPQSPHVVGYTSHQVNLLDGREDSFSQLTLTPGDTIINAAGYTHVDQAEEEPDTCFQLNTNGPVRLAHYARAHHCGFIYVSTDYVFSYPAKRTQNPTPWTTSDTPYAQCIYGQSKVEGEQRIVDAHPGAHIVRTSWLYQRYHPDHLGRKDFVTIMANKAIAEQPVNVVNDQIGSPTYVVDLADALLKLAQSSCTDTIFHYSGQGACSWYEFAQKIYSTLGKDPQLVSPITSAQLNRPAIRPAYSALDVSMWNTYGISPVYRWEDALQRALCSEQPHD